MMKHIFHRFDLKQMLDRCRFSKQSRWCVHCKEEELFEEHLMKELLAAEKLRSIILICIFTVLPIFFLCIPVCAPGIYGILFKDKVFWHGFIAFFLSIVIYEKIAMKILQRAIKKKKKSVPFIRYGIAFEEISIPSIGILLSSHMFGPVEALAGPGSFMYFLFIIVGALRLDFKLSVFTGAVAAIQYKYLPHLLLEASEITDYAVISAIPKSAMLLAAGVITGVVTVEIKNRIRSSFRSTFEISKERQARETAEAVNKKIMDSILYAKTIQDSVLPDPLALKTQFPESFLIFLPRDIVGGDLYFIDATEKDMLLAVMDCTGHGVPGAFMTMLAASGIRRITRDEGIRHPAEILKRLNFIVKTSLNQDTARAHSDDGLDAALLRIRSSNGTPASCTFSGARLPLVYTQNGDVNIIKGDRKSIGYRRSDLNHAFAEHTFPLEKGMAFYMYSDGFVDQLGGEKGIPLGTKRFKQIVKTQNHLPFDRQKEGFLAAFQQWQNNGKQERIDDVTVLGLRF